MKYSIIFKPFASVLRTQRVCGTPPCVEVRSRKGTEQNNQTTKQLPNNQLINRNNCQATNNKIIAKQLPNKQPNNKLTIYLCLLNAGKFIEYVFWVFAGFFRLQARSDLACHPRSREPHAGHAWRGAKPCSKKRSSRRQVAFLKQGPPASYGAPMGLQWDPMGSNGGNGGK